MHDPLIDVVFGRPIRPSWLTQIRNWLLIKIAAGQTVVLNATIDGAGTIWPKPGYMLVSNVTKTDTVTGSWQEEPIAYNWRTGELHDFKKV